MCTNYPKIVVTGMGVFNAAGSNVAEFTESLRAGKSGIDRMQRFPEKSIPVDIGAELSNFDFLKQIKKSRFLSPELLSRTRKGCRSAPFPVQVSAISSLEAWKSAKLDENKIYGESLGLVVAGQNIAQNYHYNMTGDYHSAAEKLNPSFAFSQGKNFFGSKYLS